MQIHSFTPFRCTLPHDYAQLPLLAQAFQLYSLYMQIASKGSN